MGLLFWGWSGRELPSPQALVPFPAWDLPPLCLLTKPGLGDILTFSYTFISFPNRQALTAPCQPFSLTQYHRHRGRGLGAMPCPLSQRRPGMQTWYPPESAQQQGCAPEASIQGKQPCPQPSLPFHPCSGAQAPRRSEAQVRPESQGEERRATQGG